jgi:hypothetical protein
LAWPLLYWLIVSLTGFLLGLSNCHHARLELRAVARDEHPLRIEALGYLVTQIVIQVGAGLGLLIGLALEVVAVLGGLHVQFSSLPSEYLVVGFVMTIPTGSAILPLLYWRRRVRTLQALERKDPGSTAHLP